MGQACLRSIIKDSSYLVEGSSGVKQGLLNTAAPPWDLEDKKNGYKCEAHTAFYALNSQIFLSLTKESHVFYEHP